MLKPLINRVPIRPTMQSPRVIGSPHSASAAQTAVGLVRTRRRDSLVARQSSGVLRNGSKTGMLGSVLVRRSVPPAGRGGPGLALSRGRHSRRAKYIRATGMAEIAARATEQDTIMLTVTSDAGHRGQAELSADQAEDLKAQLGTALLAVRMRQIEAALASLPQTAPPRAETGGHAAASSKATPAFTLFPSRLSGQGRPARKMHHGPTLSD